MLVYTRSHHKFLPKDAASRQIPVAELPVLPGKAASPSSLGTVCGYQPEPHGSHGEQSHPAHLRAQPRSSLLGWDTGMLLGWDAAHPSDPGGEVPGTMLGGELEEGRYLLLSVCSLGKTPKIIFGLT